MNRRSHLARASAKVKAADLRGRVIRALKELLRAEALASGVEGQPRKRREPSPLEVELFLQPKVANWPAEMRKYLFAHLSEILGGFRQQQQQQQQQQQEQQQQRREEPYPGEAPYSKPVPQQREAEQETIGAALLRMLEPQAERSEANARESKRIYESLTEMDPATKPVALEEAIETPVRDEVQFEVYGPGVIAPGATFALDVWAFLESQREKVTRLAERMGKAAGGTETALQRESVLSVSIYSPDLEIEKPIRVMTWKGQETFESFDCKLKGGDDRRFYAKGEVAITVSGLLVTRLRFTLTVYKHATDETRLLTHDAVRPQTAFASYASANRVEVFRAVQGIEKGAPQISVWTDVDRLRSGDDWEEKLYACIATSDIFYLFWSRAAAESEWVGREWRNALKTKGLGFIDPVPLESPELVQPPAELGKLHFNDRWVMFINSAKYVEEQKAKAAGR